MRVRIEPPEFHRLDKENSARCAEPAEVEFRNVRIETAQKII